MKIVATILAFSAVAVATAEGGGLIWGQRRLDRLRTTTGRRRGLTVNSGGGDGRRALTAGRGATTAGRRPRGGRSGRRRSVRNKVTRYIDHEGRILQEDEEDPLGPSVTSSVVPGDDGSIVDVAIIGAGAAGLYAGWRLLTATDEILRDTVSPVVLTAEGEDVENNRIGNLTVSIYEMTDRVGGSLLSVKPEVPPPPPREFDDDEDEELMMMTSMEEGRMMPEQHDFGDFIAEFGRTHVPADPTVLSSYVTNALEVEMKPVVMRGADNDEGGLAYLRGAHVRNEDLSTEAQELYRLGFLERDRTPGEILASAVRMVVGPRAHTLNATQWDVIKRRLRFHGEYLHDLGLWNVLSEVLSGEAYRLCLEALGSDSIVGYDGGGGGGGGPPGVMIGQNAAEGLHRIAMMAFHRGGHEHNNNETGGGTMNGGGGHLTPVDGMEEIALALRDGFLDAGGSIMFGHELTRLGAVVLEDEGEDGEEEGGGGEESSIGGEGRRLQDEDEGDGDGGDGDTDEPPSVEGEEVVVPHPLYDLHFANGDVVRARHVILALPKRALRMLVRNDASYLQHQEGVNDEDDEEDANVTTPSFFHGNETAGVPELIDSVSEVPSFKLFLCYPYAWWKEAGVGGDGGSEGGAASQYSSTTDQPLRRTVYYGGDHHGDEGGSGACILASYTDGWSTQPYWGSTELSMPPPPPPMMEPPTGEEGQDGSNETSGRRRRRRMKVMTTTRTTRLGSLNDDGDDEDDGDASSSPPTRWGRLRAPPKMVESAQRHLLEMHNLGYIPHPITASYVNWANEPSHSGPDGHVWNVGARSWEVLDSIRRPLRDWNVYVIGAAYSDHQGSVEGDFDTAEEVLSAYFFAPPDPGTWQSPSGSNILGEEAGFDLGEIVSVSSDGRRMALTSNSIPPVEQQEEEEEEDSPSDGDGRRRRRYLQSEEGGGGDAGQVLVYDYVGTDEVGMWVLIGSDIETRSIVSGGSQYVAILSGDGRRLVIGTVIADSENNGTNSGYFQAFEYRGRSNWTEVGDVIEVVEFAGFQDPPAVTLDETGSTLAVGAPEYLDGSGRVHVYRLHYSEEDNTATWKELGGEINGIAGHRLGVAVSLSSDGNTLAVGASGFVLVLRLINDVWIIFGDLVSTIPGEEFGLSVSLSASGDHVAVGAPAEGAGRAVVYHYSDVNDLWTEYASVEGDETGDWAGFAVDLAANGTILAVGMPFFERDSPDDPSTGKARIFRVSMDSEPEQIGADITGDATPGDVTGYTVSASTDGMRVIVGIPSLTAGGQVRSFSFVPDLEESILGNETDANSTDVEGNETDTGTGEPTIADVVGGNEDLEQLSAFLERADLIGALSGEGPLTLFAPTNDAFDDLTSFDAQDGGVSADLLNDPDSLAEVLLYHVVPGEMQMGEVEPGQEVGTAQGSSLVFDVDPITGAVTVNDGVEIETPGAPASNGVIYLVDSVLIPPNLSGGSGPGSPTNDTNSSSIETGPSPGGSPAPTILGPPTVPDDGTPSPTVEGDGTTAPTTPSDGSSEPSSLVGDDVPPPVTNRSLMDVFDDSELTLFKVALETAQMEGDFGGDEPLTVFAPTNDAFTELVNSPGGAELIDDPDRLSRVLRYHVVPGELLSTDLTEGQEATTLQGGNVVLGLDPVTVNDVNIVTPDILASNGVVHAIEEVLVPDEETVTRRLRKL